MKLRDFGLLADQNLHPDVVAFLRGAGFDVLAVHEAGLSGESDTNLLSRAFGENRVVVTHDADFGTLAVQGGQPFVGILYLRPGHVRPEPTIDTVQQVLQANPDLTPPFLIVAKRTGSTVTIRIRQGTP